MSLTHLHISQLLLSKINCKLKYNSFIANVSLYPIKHKLMAWLRGAMDSASDF